jgi:RNA polymerase sigma-70 factor, ECF subfamily
MEKRESKGQKNNALDHDLMRRVADGDLDAFGEIVTRYQQTAIQIALRFTADSLEAEDVAQDAFLKVLGAAQHYKPSGSFRAYLITVLSRLCLDRKRKKQPVYLDVLPESCDPRPDPHQLQELSARNQRIALALSQLPEPQRMASILKYYESMSYTEISRIMSVSEKRVDHLLTGARKTLCRLLGDLESL